VEGLSKRGGNWWRGLLRGVAIGGGAF